MGVLDGKDEMGVVLSPMQAALLRAVVEKERRDGQLLPADTDSDERACARRWQGPASGREKP